MATQASADFVGVCSSSPLGDTNAGGRHLGHVRVRVRDMNTRGFCFRGHVHQRLSSVSCRGRLCGICTAGVFHALRGMVHCSGRDPRCTHARTDCWSSFRRQKLCPRLSGESTNSLDRNTTWCRTSATRPGVGLQRRRLEVRRSNMQTAPPRCRWRQCPWLPACRGPPPACNCRRPR